MTDGAEAILSTERAARANPRLKDIAAELGVSATLVSMAIRGKPGVSQEMRARILRRADELGYRADPLAQSLRTGTSNTYGVVLRSLTDAFFLDVLGGIQDASDEAGAQVHFLDATGSIDRERAAIDRLADYRVGGLIIAPVADGSSVARWRERRPEAPLVVLNAEPVASVAATTVRVDNRLATQLAVEHLARLGHRHIAMLAAPVAQLAEPDRIEHFDSLCETMGLVGVTIHTQPDQQAVEAAVRGALTSTTPPTAVITNSDHAAIGLYGLAESLGMRVGQSLSVIGYGDEPYARFLDPPLTSVRVDRAALGRAAFERLAPGRQGDHVEPVTLIVRGSTASSPA